MLKIINQENKEKKEVRKTYHYKKKISFKITNNSDEEYINFDIDIYFNKEFNIKNLESINFNNYNDYNYDSERGDFYEIITNYVFDSLDVSLSDKIKDKEISEICNEIVDRIQEIIKNEQITIF
jgi:hypothetical protein